MNVNTTDATTGATALLLPAQNAHTLHDPISLWRESEKVAPRPKPPGTELHAHAIFTRLISEASLPVFQRGWGRTLINTTDATAVASAVRRVSRIYVCPGSPRCLFTCVPAPPGVFLPGRTGQGKKMGSGTRTGTHQFHRPVRVSFDVQRLAANRASSGDLEAPRGGAMPFR